MALVPDIVIAFKLDGTAKELDYRKLPFTTWQELKAALGFTPLSLLEALSAVDMEAVGAIIWLERKQHERRLAWREIVRDLDKEDHTFHLEAARVDGEVVAGDEEVVPASVVDPT